MTEPKDSHEAYQRAKLTGSVGMSNPEHSGAVQLGIQEFHRDQAKRIAQSEEDLKAAGKAVRDSFNPESRRAYEQLGEGVGIVLGLLLVWSAFGIGIYFTIPALAKLLGIGDSSLPLQQFITSINGFFAIGVGVATAVVLLLLRRKSRKRFWLANVALVAISVTILMI